MGLYYSYFKTIVEADSLASGVYQLYRKVVSLNRDSATRSCTDVHLEDPDFNIYFLKLFFLPFLG